MVDRNNGKTIIEFDGFLVEYLLPDNSIEIIDVANGREALEYNKYFVEYGASERWWDAEVVDRATGEIAAGEPHPYIVHFYNAWSGHRFVCRETYREIDPEEIDWEDFHSKNILAFKSPPKSHWYSPADPVTPQAAFDGWEPLSAMPIENEVTKIIDDYRNQNKWLKDEVDGVPILDQIKNTKWWVANKNKRVSGYVFKPKRGPHTFIWLRDDYELCPTLDAVGKSLEAFMKRVRDNDYFEPLTAGEKDWEYLASRMKRQLSWLVSPPNDGHSQRIVDKLKWWERDDVLDGYKFIPKIGSMRLIWPLGEHEFYTTRKARRCESWVRTRVEVAALP